MRIFRISGRNIGNYSASNESFSALLDDYSYNRRMGIDDPRLDDLIRFPFEPDLDNAVIGRINVNGIDKLITFYQIGYDEEPDGYRMAESNSETIEKLACSGPVWSWV